MRGTPVTRFGDVTARLGDDQVAVVRLCRPPSNYFDATLLADLHRALSWADADGARAVVLASEGRHFCAGMDFGSKGRFAGTEIYEQGANLFATRLPIVAAVSGAAVGGGLGLALVADFRVASPSTRFWANFTRLGLHHGFGITVTLPAVVGQQLSHELLLTGRRVDGAEAARIGLADRLVDESALEPEAHRLAAEIASAAPLAVRATRATLRGDLADRARAAMKRELEQQSLLVRTEDFAEGTRAARERRPPTFTGR